MAKTQAGIGYGTSIEMADFLTPAVRTYIAEAKNITLPSETTDTPDATHMHSPNRTREFVEGLTDPGEFSFEMNLVPGSASDRYLMAAKGKRKIVYVTFPTGEQLIFTGIRSGYESQAPVDDLMASTVTMKVSGSPALTDVAAPRNLVVPTIAGTAQVGGVLEVDQGVFAGAADIQYQWKAAGADIVGATGSTYVPVAADVGDIITCEVTGANASFSLTVETAATAAVVA